MVVCDVVVLELFFNVCSVFVPVGFLIVGVSVLRCFGVRCCEGEFEDDGDVVG